MRSRPLKHVPVGLICLESRGGVCLRRNLPGASTMAETAEQMHERLRGVVAVAQFEAVSRPYAWQPLGNSSQLSDNALAAVRDGSTWYALAPVAPEAPGAD